MYLKKPVFRLLMRSTHVLPRKIAVFEYISTVVMKEETKARPKIQDYFRQHFTRGSRRVHVSDSETSEYGGL